MFIFVLNSIISLLIQLFHFNISNYYTLLISFCHKDYYTHYFTVNYTYYSFSINYFNYFDYFTIISIISNQYYTYYSKWKLLNQLFYTEINYIFSIAIISIKWIYYYTNYSILLVQGGWHGPNCTSHSLHVTGPRHCPRIDEPHPASIASTRPAVARCSWKQVAQVVRNLACVPNRHKKKFSQEMPNRDDIQYGVSVVKLV